MLKLRILTANIHKGFSLGNRRFILHRLRDAIRSTDADIVFLQEVVGENSVHAKKHTIWPDQAQYEFLADSVWKHFAYGKNAIYPHGHHGNAILSKYPIVDSRQFDTSTNSFEQRGFLYCTIPIPSYPQPIHCVCVHMGIFAVSRRKQLRMKTDFFNQCISRNLPVIVAGDFNDWGGRGIEAFAFQLGMTDAALKANGRMARTFPAFNPLLPLDRIYIRGLTVHSCETLRGGVWSKLSDHTPLIAECWLP